MIPRYRVITMNHRDPVAPIEDVVRLIDVAGVSTSAVYGRSDVVEAMHEYQPVVVATDPGSETLVGAAVARVCGADAHLMAFAIHPEWRNLGIGSALLRALDQEIIHKGASRLVALVQPGQVGELAFTNQGFTRVDGLHLYLRTASMIPQELATVERYGGGFPARACGRR
ncbi:MAG TPA: GNAT family N-acetyltransferase [Acidimicrobiales bacterium]|jgi:GNAT superfamily N-acetyltransferase|nr:GNAT family N-acetyltransferase [Acidimicrobiales bacterium]